MALNLMAFLFGKIGTKCQKNYFSRKLLISHAHTVQVVISNTKIIIAYCVSNNLHWFSRPGEGLLYAFFLFFCRAYLDCSSKQKLNPKIRCLSYLPLYE